MLKTITNFKKIFIIYIIIFFFSFNNLTAKAAVYYYQDENGKIHITDTPTHSGYKVIIPSVKEQMTIADDNKFNLNVTSDKKIHNTKNNNSKFYVANISKYDHLILKYANLYNLPYNLVKAVIKAESDFNPNCTSKAGAMGLMQLMPKTAQLMGVKNPYEPEENIMGGTKYLRQMIDTFKDISLALAAYNAGPTTVIRCGYKIPQITETQNYVKKVQFYFQMFENYGNSLNDCEKSNKFAISLYKNGEIKKAISAFYKIIQESPQYAPAYYNLGYIFSQEGEYSKAIEMYKKAIKIDPYFKAAYYNLAITLERRGHFEAAIATWNAYISYETDHEKILEARKYIEELRDYISSNNL